MNAVANWPLPRLTSVVCGAMMDGSTRIRMRPSGLIRGRDRQRGPDRLLGDDRRWNVPSGGELPPPLEYGYRPPTLTDPIWLSSTVIVGRVRLSIRPCVFRARISTLNVSDPAEKTNPPTPLALARPTP